MSNNWTIFGWDLTSLRILYSREIIVPRFVVRFIATVLSDVESLAL